MFCFLVYRFQSVGRAVNTAETPYCALEPAKEVTMAKYLGASSMLYPIVHVPPADETMAVVALVNGSGTM